MAMRQSKMVLCVAVCILGMLLFAEAQNYVQHTIIVANAGENITLRCTMLTGVATGYWVKDDRNVIAAVSEDNSQGWFHDDSRFTQSYGMEISSELFKLYIYDAREESAIYACRFGNIQLQEYDVRVIGCSSCYVKSASSHGLDQARMDVNCHLNNFHTAERIILNITMNRNRTNTAIIKGSILTFNISTSMMYGTIRIEFYPFTDAMSNITCTVPAQLTTSQSYNSVKHSPSTKTSATKSETTTETTSAAIAIATTKSYDSSPKSTSSPIMETSYLTSGTTTSTGNQTRNYISPGTGNDIKINGITIIIIAILGSFLIIAVIVILILVLRLKQTRDRQIGIANEGEIYDEIDEVVATDREQDTFYESTIWKTTRIDE